MLAYLKIHVFPSPPSPLRNVCSNLQHTLISHALYNFFSWFLIEPALSSVLLPPHCSPHLLHSQATVIKQITGHIAGQWVNELLLRYWGLPLFTGCS